MTSNITDTKLQRNTLILHPALEVRSDIASLGFCGNVFKKNEVFVQNTYFVNDGNQIWCFSENPKELPGAQIAFLSKHLPFDTVYLDQMTEWAKNPTAPDTSKLYEEIKNIIHKYIELPPPAYSLITVWIIGTYFNSAFPCYPYLSFIGPKETGKSNMLELIKNLAFNAVKATLTTASLGDTADSLRGTVIIDQANNISEDLIAVLVDSYKRGGGKRQIVDISSKGRNLIEFDCYCPKVFASHDSLPDDLADRTFTVNMAPAGHKYPSPSASKTDWKSLRTRMTKIMLTYYKQVCELIDELGEDEGYRFGELWLSINTMLFLVGAPEDEIQSVKEYCQRKFAQVKYELSPWDYDLVALIASCEKEEIEADVLLSSLCQSLGTPTGAEDHRPGKQWLGKAMKRMGLIKEKKGNKHEKTIYVLEKEHANRLLGGNVETGDNAQLD